MAIDVRLYPQFEKKENSCDLPPAGTSYSALCVLKEGTSVINPVMIINRAGFDQTVANHGRPKYMRIEDFDNRYYFITDIVYTNATVEIHGTVDVLATYRAGITDERHFVLRAASRFDPNIIDTMYPAKMDPDFLSTTIVGPWEKQFDSGCVSFGVMGSGATTYYLMDYDDFDAFIQYLLSDAYATAVLGQFGLSTFPQYKMTIDPLQYITSLMWLPVSRSVLMSQTGIIERVTSIRVGNVSVSLADDPVPAVLGYQILNANYRYTWSAATNAPSTAYTLYTHSSAGTRGKWLNCAPWTKISLFYPPYGLIDIDPNALGLFQADATTRVWLQVTIDLDLRTGTSTLVLYRFRVRQGYQGDQLQNLTSVNAQVGVRFEIGQVIAPGNGVVAQYVHGGGLSNWVQSGIAEMLSTDNKIIQALGTATAGAVQIMPGVGDYIANQIPMGRTVGGTGGIDALQESPQLIYQFINPTDEARAELGRPLCQEIQLGELQGYILCRDAHTSQGITLEEKQRINHYLNTGFFNGTWGGN